MNALIATLAALTMHPGMVTQQGVDTTRYERISGSRLKDLLRGSRMHDPECETGDGCDETFSDGGRMRRSTSSTLWAAGRYSVARGSYCTAVSGSRRCFELWGDPGTGSPWLRIPVGADPRSGRIVHLVPVGS
ncbi:hypothetical protein [Sphingosinicella sp. BN140058]|uniref:hypothetical protein n=1 Tax=Sphingosinicella sp. BN140058 TaxID=1892855 RepID=UPI001012CA7E|nr:hypothetical protein [Sphingosinicella sp. BN140058]QAY75594.1 hypothetical protein ETR14_02900 [Sphingosinicella sp. BN140058]